MVACCRVGATECSSTCKELFEGGRHYLHYFHHSLVKSLSHFRLFATPWTVAHQAPLPLGFSRQEHWSGLPFPPPRDHPNPGIIPMSPRSPALAGRFSIIGPPGKPIVSKVCVCVHAKSLLVILWTVTHQTPLSTGLSREEYWSGLPCPPPGDHNTAI